MEISVHITPVDTPTRPPSVNMGEINFKNPTT
jgi:hypothetical protein